MFCGRTSGRFQVEKHELKTHVSLGSMWALCTWENKTWVGDTSWQWHCVRGRSERVRLLHVTTLAAVIREFSLFSRQTSSTLSSPSFPLTGFPVGLPVGCDSRGTAAEALTPSHLLAASRKAIFFANYSVTCEKKSFSSFTSEHQEPELLTVSVGITTELLLAFHYAKPVSFPLKTPLSSFHMLFV